MEVVALILILITVVLLIAAYKVRKTLVAISLIIVAGYLFNLSTMYGTTHTVKSNGELVYGYTAEFGWPIRYAVQTDSDTPLNDGATITFRGGGFGTAIDERKMHMNMLLLTVLFLIALMVVRHIKPKHA